MSGGSAGGRQGPAGRARVRLCVRIIGGEFRSRRLVAPARGHVVRPMPDRVRESLFGLLRGHCDGAVVLDAFAGTGALGLEALSRGAAFCLFVERDREALAALRRNVAALGVGSRCVVLVADALSPAVIQRCPRPLTLAFLDPPYAMMRDPAERARVLAQVARLVACLREDGFVILRTPWPIVQEELPAGAEGCRSARTVAGDRNTSRRHRERRLTAADLAVPDALGPETRLYRTQALHLYARPRRSSPAPSG